MTSADLAAINQRRAAAGLSPLSWTETPRRSPPLNTAAAMIGAPTVRQLRDKRGSALEQKFVRLWSEAGGPDLEREFKFHPARKWRADFCHLPTRTLIEIEGGAFCGRHTRGRGFLADAEKYLSAYLLGFQLVRLTAPQLNSDNILAVALRLKIRG